MKKMDKRVEKTDQPRRPGGSPELQNRRTTRVSFDLSQYEQLAGYAAREGKSVSKVVREAVAEYLKTKGSSL